MEHRLELILLAQRFAVTRRSPDSAIPKWATEGDVFSVTRTRDELSIVCPESVVPDAEKSERGWRCLRIAGVIPFATVGILVSLTEPLAKAGVSLFVISTFDTDYLLVKEESLRVATAALRCAGHHIREVPVSP